MYGTVLRDEEKKRLANRIVDAVVKEIQESCMVEVEASGRHVHLCRADIDALFGTGYQLTESGTYLTGDLSARRVSAWRT